MEYHHQELILQVDDEERMLPCQYYLNGFCVQGPRCRFYHPPSEQIPSSIRVPPFCPAFGTPGVLVNNQPSIPFYSEQSSQAFEYMNTPRPTNYNFGQEQEFSKYSMSRSKSSFRNRVRDYGNGEDGDGCLRYLPHGITSVTKNGLVTYTYPNATQENRSTAPPRRNQRYNARENDDRLASAPTMFTHINWSEFLIPGFPAPPLVHVPLEDLEPQELVRVKTIRPPESYKVKNVDLPPEGCRKMSAKEEFHTKVKLTALDHTDEPLTQVRSLDSFFRNHDRLETLPAIMLERRNLIGSPRSSIVSSESSSETKRFSSLESVAESYEAGPDESEE